MNPPNLQKAAKDLEALAFSKQEIKDLLDPL